MNNGYVMRCNCRVHGMTLLLSIDNGGPCVQHREGKRRLAFRIPISIVAVKGRAIAGVNAVDHPKRPGDCKIPIGLYRDSSHVGADLLSFGDHRAHHIAGLKTSDLARPFGAAPGKAPSIDIAHLPALSTFSRDEERNHLLPEYAFWHRLTHAHRIQPVRFWYPVLLSIPFSATS